MARRPQRIGEGLQDASALLGVPQPHFKSDLVDEIFPHVDNVQKASLIFLQSGKVSYPEKPDGASQSPGQGSSSYAPGTR